MVARQVATDTTMAPQTGAQRRTPGISGGGGGRYLRVVSRLLFRAPGPDERYQANEILMRTLQDGRHGIGAIARVIRVMLATFGDTVFQKSFTNHYTLQVCVCVFSLSAPCAARVLQTQIHTTELQVSVGDGSWETRASPAIDSTRRLR